ncbi:hypothetical protein CK203_070473 [Vitis vinifera]|uniref:Yippee domain-containing protein n=1 Tax=Vitis vinifera TaxID=29760 RepID=A0A438FBI5_VITVI|nr:hypothetical protein CK203_070473 [Vitis vinifera]
MGRLFLVEFDQTPEVNFYCCRTCQAHIVLAQHCFSRVTSASLLILFVNVVVDERTRREGFFQVEDIHCVRCNKPLGWRYKKNQKNSQQSNEEEEILSKQSNEYYFVQIPAQPNGTVLLKLIHEQGSSSVLGRSKLLNADTLLDPVVDQENQEDHDQENQENQEDQGNQGEEDEDDQGPDDNVDID